MGAAGEDRTVIFSTPISQPPGARDSDRTRPDSSTVHSSHSPSDSTWGLHTHWMAPSAMRRVKKVMPPMSRRAWTAPWTVTDWLFSPPSAMV